MELLMNGLAWVCFIFGDGTQHLLHTTLNKAMLESMGVELRSGYFFDVDHLVYEPYREDACDVEVNLHQSQTTLCGESLVLPLILFVQQINITVQYQKILEIVSRMEVGR